MKRFAEAKYEKQERFGYCRHLLRPYCRLDSPMQLHRLHHAYCGGWLWMDSAVQGRELTRRRHWRLLFSLVGCSIGFGNRTCGRLHPAKDHWPLTYSSATLPNTAASVRSCDSPQPKTTKSSLVRPAPSACFRRRRTNALSGHIGLMKMMTQQAAQAQRWHPRRELQNFTGCLWSCDHSCETRPNCSSYQTRPSKRVKSCQGQHF